MPAGGASSTSLPPNAQQASGANPATMPVANRGSEQMALMAIGMHARQIQQLATKLPFGSDAQRDIAEALQKISKHAKDQAAPPGVERTQADAMQIAARQNAMRLAQMRQQAQGGAAAQPSSMAA